eukprot:3607621-Pyramimonas_sp.AAC.1
MGRFGSLGRGSIVFNQGSLLERFWNAWEQGVGMREVRDPRAVVRGMRGLGVSSHAGSAQSSSGRA